MNKRLLELAEQTKEHNWDDERGHPISMSAWNKTQAFLDICAAEKFPEPYVSPCGDGTVHFNWFTSDGNRAVVEMDWDGYSQSETIGMWTEMEKGKEPKFVTLTDENADSLLGFLKKFFKKEE